MHRRCDFRAFCFFGLLATAPFAVQQWVPPTTREWGLLLAVGLTAVAAQVLFTIALRRVRAATSGVISQLTPITATVLGVGFLGDPLGRTAIAGSVLTIGAVAWAAWNAREKELPPS